ncbi:MAG TPA: BON domain-containing protein [Abditibacterium sp.]|jgi:osmotically-inducible protein OsmY
MQNFRKMGAFLGAGAVIFSLAGCADKNGNGQAESPANPDNVSGAVKDNLGDTANAVGAGAEKVGDAASNAASGAGAAIANAGEAATLTPKVKTAIAASAGLKGTNINVDTLGSKDSIALRGKVKSASQKTLAESVAKKAAPGYKIVNQLTVGG